MSVRPAEGSDFSSEDALRRVDGILTLLEEGYRLSREEAQSCLAAMARAVSHFPPDDPGAQASFHNSVSSRKEFGEPWAEKVDKAIMDWGSDK